MRRVGLGFGEPVLAFVALRKTLGGEKWKSSGSDRTNKIAIACDYAVT